MADLTWADEANWLTPSGNEKSETDFDLDGFLKSKVSLPSTASLLSDRIAKTMRKRAAKASRSLSSVREEKASSTNGVKECCRHEKERSFGSCVATTREPEKISSTDSRNWAMSEFFDSTKEGFSSEAEFPVEETAITADEEDEFHDASSEFPEETLKVISMSSSFNAIEKLISAMDDPAVIGSGYSNRPNPTAMTQSLVKVDEEEINVQPFVADFHLKTARSSSVSPRPVKTEHTRVQQDGLLNKTFNRNERGRSSLGASSKIHDKTSKRSSSVIGKTFSKSNGVLHTTTGDSKCSSSALESLEALEERANQQQQELLRRVNKYGDKISQGDRGQSAPPTAQLTARHSANGQLYQEIVSSKPDSSRRVSRLPMPKARISVPLRTKLSDVKYSSNEVDGKSADLWPEDCF